MLFSLSMTRRAMRYRKVPLAARRGDVVIGYVGWTGEGNLGDEAMYLCHQYAYPENFRFVALPTLGPNFVLEHYAASRLDAICLGGGTLIGNGFFREGIQALQEARPDLPNFMLGVGCEDHTYRVGNRASVVDEIGSWKPILARFDTVRVRGPLSAESVRLAHPDPVVTADPAVLLPTFNTPVRPRRIGLNIGVVDDSWGNAGEGIDGIGEALVALLQRLNLDVVLLPTTDEDYAYAKRSPHLRDLAISSAASARDPLQYARESATCDLIIGMKLHAVIIASSQLVPSVCLEYRPKCKDFMISIGRGDRCMRLDEMDLAQLESWIMADLGSRADVVDSLSSVMAEQRARLLAAAEADLQLLSS